MMHIDGDGCVVVGGGIWAVDEAEVGVVEVEAVPGVEVVLDEAGNWPPAGDICNEWELVGVR